MRGSVHLSPWEDAQMIRSIWNTPDIVESLHDEFTVPGKFSEERFRALLVSLSVETSRCLDETHPDEPRLSRSQAHELIDYFRQHINQRPTPADFARELRLSPAYFARVFKRTFKLSPRQWLVAQRVRHGADLLMDTNLDVSEIAYRLGYDEPRLFTRQFRMYMGTTPSLYRIRQG
ncbi:MAG: helix-turn-helix transcriptional regulator, partial [Planctomycetes bacterium]|nr:helix-turn-helix transcriptional regulator [Planctomycetota bacterium]